MKKQTVFETREELEKNLTDGQKGYLVNGKFVIAPSTTSALQRALAAKVAGITCVELAALPTLPEVLESVARMNDKEKAQVVKAAK